MLQSLDRKAAQVTTNRLDAQHSCFGPEIPYGMVPNPEGETKISRRKRRPSLKTVCTFIVLMAITAYCGYRDATSPPVPSSDRWAGLFALSLGLLVLRTLLCVPRIAKAWASKPKYD